VDALGEDFDDCPRIFVGLNKLGLIFADAAS
jgi:hypothetical protein